MTDTYCLVYKVVQTFVNDTRIFKIHLLKMKKDFGAMHDLTLLTHKKAVGCSHVGRGVVGSWGRHGEMLKMIKEEGGQTFFYIISQ